VKRGPELLLLLVKADMSKSKAVYQGPLNTSSSRQDTPGPPPAHAQLRNKVDK